MLFNKLAFFRTVFWFTTMSFHDKPAVSVFNVCVVVHVDGVRLCLWTAATNGYIVHTPDDIWIWSATVEWYWQGENRRAQIKTYPSAILSTRNSTWARTRASSGRGRLLTTWAMVMPSTQATYTGLHSEITQMMTLLSHFRQYISSLTFYVFLPCFPYSIFFHIFSRLSFLSFFLYFIPLCLFFNTCCCLRTCLDLNHILELVYLYGHVTNILPYLNGFWRGTYLDLSLS
jgi:hypothetical protein